MACASHSFTSLLIALVISLSSPVNAAIPHAKNLKHTGLHKVAISQVAPNPFQNSEPKSNFTAIAVDPIKQDYTVLYQRSRVPKINWSLAALFGFLSMLLVCLWRIGFRESNGEKAIQEEGVSDESGSRRLRWGEDVNQ